MKLEEIQNELGERGRKTKRSIPLFLKERILTVLAHVSYGRGEKKANTKTKKIE
jgi:hypothetical protein